MKANTSEYDGKTWERSWSPMMSNSGKTVIDADTIFRGADGRVIYKARGNPNRRNDPDRNWGLPE